MFLILSNSTFLTAQTDEQISSLFLPALVTGKISASEAEEIRQYLVQFGLPGVAPWKDEIELGVGIG